MSTKLSNKNSFKVLHYIGTEKKWQEICSKSVDFDNKTITQEFKNLSPVAVVYQAGDANANKNGTKANSTKVSDSTILFYLFALGCSIGVDFAI